MFEATADSEVMTDAPSLVALYRLSRQGEVAPAIDLPAPDITSRLRLGSSRGEARRELR